MRDNVTAHNASEYDMNITKTIPFYEQFHDETIHLLQHYNQTIEKWLDIGCGTGTLIEKVMPLFKDTEFILCDSSDKMLEEAKVKLQKLDKHSLRYLSPCISQNIETYLHEKVNAITAICVHHYLSKEDRFLATSQCYNVLDEEGIYVTFENIKPSSLEGIEIALERWGDFQLRQGKVYEEVEKHKARFDNAYYPISIEEHMALLKKVGFKVCEVFWCSYMQAGFYAIK